MSGLVSGGHLSVQDFFSQISWEGPVYRPVEVSRPVEPTGVETVAQFFDTFPWEGTAVAVSPSPPPLPEKGDGASLTLEALSELF